MKSYQSLIALLFCGFALASCDSELEEKVSLNVGVTADGNVKTVGDTVIVKKGKPVEFRLGGNPDFITFFSGEPGSKYEYRERVMIDAADIASSHLMFSVWEQYGNAASAAGVLSMYISDSFPGLYKNNFAADSALVETSLWKDLVPQSDLPQAPVSSVAGAKSFDLDMKPYLGKAITIAVKYKGQNNSAAQPRVNFVKMQIVNRMKDGTSSTLMASNMGFTAVNMCNRLHLEDQKSMTNNRAYGTVTNNTAGIWNLTGVAKGNFFIHSSNAKRALKYSWLVSNHILVNACTPDVGVNIKNISRNLDAYSYVYNTTGTYKATFLAVNGNYKKTSSVIRQINIKVVE